VYRSANSDQGYHTGTEGSTFSTGRMTFVDSGLVGVQCFSMGSVRWCPMGRAICPLDGMSVLSDTRGPAAPAFLDPAADDPELLNISMGRLIPRALERR